MNPEVGDIVFVDIQKMRLLEFGGVIKNRITPAIITSIHDAERPYNIEGIEDYWTGTCDEGAIVEGWEGKTCNHTSVVYHEKKESWVCPFCLE